MRVPPTPSMTDMIFTVYRLHYLRRKVRVQLSLCFNDIQKPNNSVDCPLILQLLVRFGVPPQMHELIRQLHDGMRVCVWNNDGRYSKWFEGAQRLRQGYVISSLLPDDFFATVLLVTLKRFSEDADILAGLVHLQKQPSKIDPETALECVYRAI